MEFREALDQLDGLTSDDDRELRLTVSDKAELPVQIAALLSRFRGRITDEDYEPEPDEAAASFRLIEELRYAADEHERALLRHLKWGGEGMTWEQVSATIDGQLGGRQAMQKRWARLTSSSRRTTTGNMRRGAAARRSTVSGVDTTTSTE